MDQHAQISDMTHPLASLKEDLWGLEAAQWQELENCIHLVASEADADIHAAWRPDAARHLQQNSSAGT